MRHLETKIVLVELCFVYCVNTINYQIVIELITEFVEEEQSDNCSKIYVLLFLC